MSLHVERSARDLSRASSSLPGIEAPPTGDSEREAAVGRKLRFRPEAIADYIESNTRPAA